MDQSTTRSGPALRRAGFVGPGWALLRRAFGWLRRVCLARQLLHRLSALSDVELRDIGLTRFDLQAAHALPLDADPSALLSRSAQERRDALWLALRRTDGRQSRRSRPTAP